MPTAPVTEKRIELAKAEGLVNVEEAAIACRKANLPFWAACALLEKESGGRKVWGGADASPYAELNKLDIPITEASFWAFYVGVLAGHTPTGVNATQITYAGALKNGRRDGGYFRIMLERGLKPWSVHDAMFFGFELLWNHYLKHGHSWRNAGRIYNGAESYGVDLLDKCEWWKDYLEARGPINP